MIPKAPRPRNVVVHPDALDDCEVMNEASPATFWIPPRAERESLDYGDRAKVLLPGERFWVECAFRSMVNT